MKEPRHKASRFVGTIRELEIKDTKGRIIHGSGVDIRDTVKKKEKSTGRVFGYTRVSTDSQSDNTSLETQKERIEAFATSKGTSITGIFQDVASGATLNRDGLDKLRTTLAPGDSIVVYRLDRLSRSVVDASPLIEDWERQGVSLHSVSEPIETATPLGRAMFKMVLVFAQAERELISERVKSGKLKNAQDGGTNGHRTPYGYRPGSKQERDFEVVSDEAKTVLQLFTRYASGNIGLTRLKRETKCHLSEQAIAELLSSVFYTGRIRYMDTIQFNNHVRIVSDRLYYKVQKAKLQRAKGGANNLFKVVEGRALTRPLHKHRCNDANEI